MKDDCKELIGALLIFVGVGIVGVFILQFLFWISYIVGWIGVGILAILVGGTLLDN